LARTLSTTLYPYTTLFRSRRGPSLFDAENDDHTFFWRFSGKSGERGPGKRGRARRGAAPREPGGGRSIRWRGGPRFPDRGAAWRSGRGKSGRGLRPGKRGWKRARGRGRPPGDRKSTRLNSSHVKISYAVFCLKKKNS